MKTVVNVVASILILATGVAGFRFFGQKPEVPTQDANGDGAVVVETKAVVDGLQHFCLNTDGEAVTYRVVEVGAEVEGRIFRKYVAARGGTYVGKGERLFEIDPANYQLEVERLDAELDHVAAEIDAVSVDLKNTEALIKLAEEDCQLQMNQLERMQSLFKRKTANEMEVETAMKQELTARKALQTLHNQQSTLRQQWITNDKTRRLFEVQFTRAEVDVERCTVISPLEGRIVDDSVEEGDYVKSGDVLVNISDASRMEVKCQLRGEEYAWVMQQPWPQAEEQSSDLPETANVFDPGKPPPVKCEVIFEFEGVETIWKGYISRFEGSGIDRDTRTIPCRILVEEPYTSYVNDSVGGGAAISPPSLVSGMFVGVRIWIKSPKPLLQLPVEAVRPRGEIWVNRDDKLEIRDIFVVHTEGQTALVRAVGSGLQVGDRVVVSPLAVVTKGMSLTELPE
ncbi:MAG: HlyD family efflux transporter periplasmic adaptor subunit [Fuerstiella sp.]